jgi:SNF2 family DNA or RNA helicase
VEERILELQQRKAELASIAFDETSGGMAFDFNDINFLFGADPEKQAEAA